MEETYRAMESYLTNGTCSKQIIFRVEDDVLTECRFINGCNGNLQAITKLSVGMKIDELIEKFKDIKCRNNTSCPAQLAQALIQYKRNTEKPFAAAAARQIIPNAK